MGLIEWIRSHRAHRRDPREIFTPTSLVKPEMFEPRREPDLRGKLNVQELLMGALRNPGEQVLIYGDSGVGKTSLLRHAAAELGIPLVSIGCLSERSYEAIVRDCVGNLIDFTEVGFTESENVVFGTDVGVGVPKLMSVKGTTKSEFGRAQSFRAVQKEPIDVLLAAMKATGRRLIVLDNFQNVDDADARRLVGQTMERLSDRSSETGDAKLVVIGVASDATSLLSRSGSITRRTTEIGVPRMPDDEISQIFAKGFRLLDLAPDVGVVERLVYFSDGFPYFAHLLGRMVALDARRENVRAFSFNKVTAALKQAAQQVDQSYASRVQLALETGGGVQPRRRILKVLAYDEAREWTSGQITTLVRKKGGDIADGGLMTALTALTGDGNGRILKRRGTPGRYVYTFHDPHMRPYLRVAAFPHGADPIGGPPSQPRESIASGHLRDSPLESG